MSKILLLEDDLSLIDGLSYSLIKQGFQLDIARTIKEAKGLLLNGTYDLLLLDLSLPDGSGFEICKKVRESSSVPIIFLTAADEEVNIVMGLDIGGDDYITKPFKLNELLSRINALLRRTKAFSIEEKDQAEKEQAEKEQAEKELTSNDIKIMLLRGQVYKDNKLLDLTGAEYKLLCFFMENPDMVLSKTLILDRLWDNNGDYIDDNTLAVYIRRLRMKIETDANNPKMLVTMRGMGYKWDTNYGRHKIR